MHLITGRLSAPPGVWIVPDRKYFWTDRAWQFMPKKIYARGRVVLAYDRKQGILSLDMQKNELEQLLHEFGRVPSHVAVTAVTSEGTVRAYFDGVCYFHVLHQSGAPVLFREDVRKSSRLRNMLGRLLFTYASSIQAVLPQ